MRFLTATAAALLSLSVAAPSLADDHGDHSSMETVLAADFRADDRARDEFRNPAETLEFFGVEPGMKVGEYAPGGGWYSRVLAPYLGEDGRLVGLAFNPDITPFPDETKQRIRDGASEFPAKIAGEVGMDAADIGAFTLDAIPEEELGTFDRVLLIRMLHNIVRWDMANAEIRAMRSLLKDDGLFGVVQHRAKADAPWSYADGNKGYLRTDDVVAVMRINGFELVGMSNVNANPRDTADHEGGVWEMPPRLATESAELAELGESDRMTLLFRKAD